jgi:hypothetical protein
LVVLAIVPFHLPLLQHLFAGSLATGFMQYDAPYYMANARAIFERGNGLTYPNAFESDPTAPAIYFHWLIWLLGAGVKLLHADPGVLFAGLGVAASVVCSALTLRLVELVLPRREGVWVWFLLTMWGGGILCLSTAGANLVAGQPLFEALLRYDPDQGWWFPNWGRNLLLATEAVYHCLVAVAWVGIAQRKWWLAITAIVSLAATHPFSGLQHLSILAVWFGGLALREHTHAAWQRVGFIGVSMAVFGLYYFRFLNEFPSHRRLVALWSTGYDIGLGSILLAVGPLALVGMIRIRNRSWSPDQTEWFWIVASFVSFALMQHGWFIAPHQPAHFSRGYLWLSLWLLALPQLQAWSIRLVQLRGRIVGLAILLVLAGVATSDNAAFIWSNLTQGHARRVLLSPAQREVFAWMDRAGLRGILLCYDPRLSYYSAAYTGVRPYLGHLVNTPDIRTRWDQVAALHRHGKPGPWLQDIDYILVERLNAPVGFDWQSWRELHANDEYVLLARAISGPGP